MSIRIEETAAVDNIAINNRMRQLLRSVGPLLDTFEAICEATAQGDTDRAWQVARSSCKNAKVVKVEAANLSRALNREHRK